MKQRYTHFDNSQSQSAIKAKTLPLKKPNPFLDRLSRIIDKAEPVLLASGQNTPMWIEKKPTMLAASFEKNYATEPIARLSNLKSSISFENKSPLIQKNENKTETRLASKKANHFNARGILGSLLGIVVSIIVLVVVVILILFLLAILV